jgi:hypothetical protein
MLQHYRTEYKAAPAGSKHLEPHQLGIVKGEPVAVAGPPPGDGSGE